MFNHKSMAFPGMKKIKTIDKSDSIKQNKNYVKCKMIEDNHTTSSSSHMHTKTSIE